MVRQDNVQSMDSLKKEGVERNAWSCVESNANYRLAVQMRDEAAQIRLRLWLERFQKLDGSGRDAILDQGLAAAMSVCSADFANIQLVHGCGLQIEAQRGFKKPFLDFFAFVDQVDTSCGAALKLNQSVVVPDVTASPIFSNRATLEVLLAAKVRAVKSTPLLARNGRIIGMLNVHYRSPRRDSPNEVVRLRAVADRIATLLDGRPPESGTVGPSAT